MSGRAGDPGLTPMNGMAGAGLATGIFALLVAILVGFASVPFAAVAVIAGVFAVFFSLRGRAIARVHGGAARIAQGGLITGALAVLLGVLGILFR